MTHEEIAKQAKKIAHRILEQTKCLKNDTRFGYDTEAQWEAHSIAEMCVELQNLLLPIRYY